MKIEFIEQVKHQGDDFDVGDRKNFDDETGAYFCANGWAKDLDGKAETVARDVNRKIILDVEKVNANLTAGEI